MKIKSKITGEIVDLSQEGQTIPRDVLALPMQKLSERLRERMKGMTPVGSTGNLKASIDCKILVYGAKNRVVGIIGPKTRARGRPTRYADLVEFGHKVGGAAAKHASYVQPHPFVRPTAEIARSVAVQELGAEAEPLLKGWSQQAKGSGKKKKILKESF